MFTGLYICSFSVSFITSQVYPSMHIASYNCLAYSSRYSCPSMFLSIRSHFGSRLNHPAVGGNDQNPRRARLSIYPQVLITPLPVQGGCTYSIRCDKLCTHSTRSQHTRILGYLGYRDQGCLWHSGPFSGIARCLQHL